MKIFCAARVTLSMIGIILYGRQWRARKTLSFGKSWRPSPGHAQYAGVTSKNIRIHQFYRCPSFSPECVIKLPCLITGRSGHTLRAAGRGSWARCRLARFANSLCYFKHFFLSQRKTAPLFSNKKCIY